MPSSSTSSVLFSSPSLIPRDQASISTALLRVFSSTPTFTTFTASPAATTTATATTNGTMETPATTITTTDTTSNPPSITHFQTSSIASDSTTIATTATTNATSRPIDSFPNPMIEPFSERLSPPLSSFRSIAAAAAADDDGNPPAIRATLASLRASTMTNSPPALPPRFRTSSGSASTASNFVSRTSSAASASSASVPHAFSSSSRGASTSSSRAAAAAAISTAATRSQTRRQRRERIGVRFEFSNNINRPTVAAESENVSTLSPGASPRSGSGFVSLAQRRRLSQRECAIADVRLARKFPHCLFRAMSAIHLVICMLVLFVQFWTSARGGSKRQWVRSVNTYGYMCALLAGLAGCSGIAFFLQQSKNRAICFLCMSVGTASSCCYLLTFYTSYFAEIRMLPSAKGCIEEYDKHPDFKVPFACMTFLTLVGFFNAFVSILVVSTLINRARACWWSCDPCNLCQLDEDIEEGLEDDESEAQLGTVVPGVTANRFSSQFEMPPAYFDHPPPYKP